MRLYLLKGGFKLQWVNPRMDGGDGFASRLCQMNFFVLKVGKKYLERG